MWRMRKEKPLIYCTMFTLGMINVHIGNDQTKWEQMEYKNLKDELVRRKRSGESDLIIRDTVYAN